MAIWRIPQEALTFGIGLGGILWRQMLWFCRGRTISRSLPLWLKARQMSVVCRDVAEGAADIGGISGCKGRGEDMVQKTYKVEDFHDGSFERILDEVAAGREYRDAAQVLLLMFEQNWEEDRILAKTEIIRKKLPKAELVGINHREARNDEFADKEYTEMSFLIFEKPAFSFLKYDLKGAAETEVGRHLNRDLREMGHVSGVMLLLAEISKNLEAMFEEAEKGMEEIPFFGAPAAVPSLQVNNGVGHVFDATGFYADYMLAVVFHGEELRLKVSYNYGWTPVGKTMTITKMNGPFQVQTIDHRPAAEIYYKYLGLCREQLNVLNICEFPLIVVNEGPTVARIPMYGDEKGNLFFAASLREGDKIRFSYGAQNRIFSEVEEDSLGYDEFGAQGILLIICGNRLLFLKEQEEHEVDCYRRFQPELAWLHGNSELFRQKGLGGEMNSALVAVGFREGEKKAKEDVKNTETLQKENCPYNAMEVPLEYRVMNFMQAETEDLEEMAERAKEANEAKSRFLSSMSHEIRTPINAVLGMNEMILRESSEEQIRDYAMDIRNAGNTLLSLINDILDVSKIESGRMEIVPERYDLSSMINDLATMIGVRAKGKNLSFRVKVSKELPSGLYGDDVRIRQVLTNILTNAVKYTPEGWVELRVDGERSPENTKQLILKCEVEDTGIGMKEEDLPKLFEAFERIEEQRNRNIEGTGLGMNITQRLLKMMGSVLEVESVYGKGSIFRFELRQDIVDDTPMGNFEDRIRNIAEGYRYERSFIAPEAHILVVDDNELNLKVFVNLLKQTGMQIMTAGSGKECLEIVKAEKFDVIFLDHMMPEMDGIETLHRMKEMEASPNRDTPVYALSANAVAGAKEKYLAEGFDGFVAKPVVGEKLEKVIRKALPSEKVEVGGVLRTDRGWAGTEKKEDSHSLPEDLPIIDGLDWNYAWLHISDRELLMTTLRDFGITIENQADKLEKFYQALPAKEASDAYRIQVHGMKSAAATVGLTILSGMANRLEYAARDGEYEVIRSMHGIFLASWRSYKEKLKELFPAGRADSEEGTEDGRIELDEAKIPLVAARLEMLKYSMMNMDLDGLDNGMKELLEYRYCDELAEKMEKLSGAVTALDTEMVTWLADQLIRELTKERT